MRTELIDQPVSQEALQMARSYIESEFGKEYLPEKHNTYASSNKIAQEAHEAIRPTDANFTPRDAHAKLGPDEAKLYQLIWNRFLACQMPPAPVPIKRQRNVGRRNVRRKRRLHAPSGSSFVFDGYTRVCGRFQRGAASARPGAGPTGSPTSRSNRRSISPSRRRVTPRPVL